MSTSIKSVLIAWLLLTVVYLPDIWKSNFIADMFSGFAAGILGYIIVRSLN